jgi:hypothetical protein
VGRIAHRPLRERSVMFVARLAFRGIYFPQTRAVQWLRLLWSNRRTLLNLCGEAFRGTPQAATTVPPAAGKLKKAQSGM